MDLGFIFVTLMGAMGGIVGVSWFVLIKDQKNEWALERKRVVCNLRDSVTSWKDDGL